MLQYNATHRTTFGDEWPVATDKVTVASGTQRTRVAASRDHVVEAPASIRDAVVCLGAHQLGPPHLPPFNSPLLSRLFHRVFGCCCVLETISTKFTRSL